MPAMETDQATGVEGAVLARRRHGFSSARWPWLACPLDQADVVELMLESWR